MTEQKYVTPLSPDVADAFAALSEDAKEFFSERAAILEFDAGFSRQQAETSALVETLRWLKTRPSPQ